ncbi:MAG TPA: hypothetical protein EYQ18_20335 [Candidatus Handelsmanbacteria bacterium]|nr:hypothetical protein [Candidatus Handelsmanbacteria bacterium]
MQPRFLRRLGLAIQLFNAALIISCTPDQPASQPSIRPALPQIATDSYSNIRPTDYVGPQACGECHETNYANWQRHPHSRMNMPANAETVLADFSGRTVSYADQRALFRREGDDFLVEYFTGNQLNRQFRLTRVIGWRYEQDYIAVQTHGPEPADDPIYREERQLKFSYSLTHQQWLPQSYLEPTEFPGPEYHTDGSLRHNPFSASNAGFNQRCAYCHNTYPYDLRFYKIRSEEGMLSGFPPGAAATPSIVQALAKEAGDLSRLQEQGLPLDRLVTIGISCESCHFGGREHAQNDREIRFVPTHPLLVDWTPDHRNARNKPAIINAICRQCHHSGARAPDNWPDGSAGVNSMEASEMDRGACQGALSCTTCHDTHISGPQAGAPDRADHLAACVDCHSAYQNPTAAAQHSHHTPEQASCLDCHMPRIVQSFAVYNRSHRISSPNEPAILATGMPNACNLCHLDQTLLWTRDALKENWGNAPQLPPALKNYFGRDLERPAGAAWLDHPSPLLRTVAAGAYARSPLGKAALPTIIARLNEPNAYARMRFLMSVEKIIGREISNEEYTLTGSTIIRQKQIEHLLKQYH